ncbi:MAG: 3-isopropylmalate dehydratase small subunit [Candidatus Binatia bacterium]|nr:3-isopropylmalate dehydratase small subunit [Candidatus Binatia bacterium]MDG2008430.1 3-isopropylmalate dehydratase small subunit [Candidatus Binatia bacterium]
MTETEKSGLRPVTGVTGHPVPLRGNDIDTDRIIPARFMTAITFDGMGELAFYDVRFDADGNEVEHPMNDPKHRAKGPQVAVVNKNFGCGSSREHAPQAMHRWGVHAIVGESFADIFFGNCVALGIPCLTLDTADIEKLMAAVEQEPAQSLAVDVEKNEVRHGETVYSGTMPASAREQFLSGNWDATGALLSALPEVRSTAAKLPYTRGFAG